MGIFAQYRNAHSAPIHPAAKQTVPFFQFQNRGSVRALGVDQQLFVKRTFIVAAGAAEKIRPAFSVARDVAGYNFVEFGD